MTSTVVSDSDPFENITIVIPINVSADVDSQKIVAYPDELPEEHRALSDVLIATFAPLKIWKACAVSDCSQIVRPVHCIVCVFSNSHNLCSHPCDLYLGTV